MVEFKTQAFTVSDLYNWFRSGELFLQPKFQRRRVWKPAARSFLLDTVLRGLPMPKIYFRMQVDPTTLKSVREVIDGQQRLAAVFDYIEGKFKVSRNHSPVAGGKTFDELPNAVRSQILSYDVSADLLIGADDAQVLQIFARINSYSVTLNAQEKRNAKFLGPFKQMAYELGSTHVKFWTDNKILTFERIARMAEAELVSEFMVGLLGGLQDKKASLDKYYEAYEDAFPDAKLIRTRVETTLEWISQNAIAAMKDTVFVRRTLFYSMFMAIADALYGIDKGNGPTKSFANRPLTTAQRRRLAEQLQKASDAIRSKAPPTSMQKLATASAQQTDNIGPRRVRHRFLYNALKTL